ncbi:MAG: YbhB/YbcL family Raf kinase inhibitor-like protein [Planctomycetota bacterium]
MSSDAVSWFSLSAWILGLGACSVVVQTPAKQADPRGDARTENLPMTIQLQSPAFTHNAIIPKKFSEDGEDLSPELQWSHLPSGVKELALICDDPDAPAPEPWVHWVIFKIPATATGLSENVAKVEKPAAPAGALQGKNSWGKIGYGGPAPPQGHGVHHYHFRLYALDAALTLPPGADKKTLLGAMKGHTLATGELIGTYQR